MIRRLFGLIILIPCAVLQNAQAADKPLNALVLPFTVNAAQDLFYLQKDIPEAIGRHLGQEGASMLETPPRFQTADPQQAWTSAAARSAGMETGADFVIWGSFTLIGDQFSLDVQLIEVFTTGAPSVFSVAGSGMENLPVRLKDLVVEIIPVIFKRVSIAVIEIQGNKRIEADAIRKMIKSSPGEVYSVKALSEDLKSVFSMGYFDDVRIEAEDDPKGKIIIFKVKEKPTVRYIRFEGNRVFENQELMENLTFKTGSILNITIIQNNIRRIEELYKEKNYHNVRIEYKIAENTNNQADVDFVINEGDKIKVKQIRFVGNKEYTAKQLMKQIETSEKGFFSIITNSGEFKKEELDQDVGRLESFYHNNGYIRAKVGEPQVDFEKEGINITFKIEEGPRYRVGKIDLAGDLIFPKEMLLEKIKIKNEEYYNRTVLREDLLTLGDLYADEGYAYSNIMPVIDEEPDNLVVNILYRIEKGKLVYFEEIVITGNTKTRDKVIRRQLEVYEEGLYSGARLKKSVRNLFRLDYFEDVKVNTAKGAADDKMVLKIDVKEKSTGQFSFGGGFSNTEGLFAVGSVSQRNLFGRGQILNVQAEVGGLTQRYSIGFTEPWLFDIPLSAGGRIYNWAREYDAYDRDSKGISASLGYPIMRDTRLSMGLSYDIANIEITNPDGVPLSIIELVDQVGTSDIVTLALTSRLLYDSRDQRFSAKEGAYHFINFELANFGGDIGFTKYIAQLSWWIPLFRSFTGYIGGRGGIVNELSGYVLPDYDKFFIGGYNGVRGFDEDEIQPRDDEGNKIGGDRYFVGTLEVIHPLVSNLGLDGYVFFDIGTVVDTQSIDPAFRKIDSNTIREGVGVGFRWNSPLGPIELAYGWKIDKREEESPGNWEFRIGGAF